MELKDLSKIKYIYRIYESKDYVLHLEKYPVIYINSEMLYFKVHGNKTLNSIYINNILDCHVKYEDLKFCAKYFWGISTDINDVFEDLKMQQSKYIPEQTKKEYQKALNELKQLYNKSIKQLDIVSELRKKVDSISKEEMGTEIEKHGKLFDEIQRYLQGKSSY